MRFDKEAALRQLDAVIDQLEGKDPRSPKMGAPATSDGFTKARLLSVIQRLSPPGSAYWSQARSEANQYILLGIAKALREDYATDCLDSFRELINGDLFSDFLEMAEYLLQDEKLKQPAAVLAGGVLEEHLRKLSSKHGIDTELADSSGNMRPKKADAMNAELRKADVYGQNDQKQVTAWCGIRNSAAHAKHDEFDESQVANMIQGLRAFISRTPA